MAASYNVFSGAIPFENENDLNLKKREFDSHLTDIKDMYITYFAENPESIYLKFADNTHHNDDSVSCEFHINFLKEINTKIKEDYMNSIRLLEYIIIN